MSSSFPRSSQSGDGALYEGRAIVGQADFRPRGQAAFEGPRRAFTASMVPDICALAHNDEGADDFTLTI